MCGLKRYLKDMCIRLLCFNNMQEPMTQISYQDIEIKKNFSSMLKTTQPARYCFTSQFHVYFILYQLQSKSKTQSATQFQIVCVETFYNKRFLLATNTFGYSNHVLTIGNKDQVRLVFIKQQNMFIYWPGGANTQDFSKIEGMDVVVTAITLVCTGSHMFPHPLEVFIL